MWDMAICSGTKIYKMAPSLGTITFNSVGAINLAEAPPVEALQLN